MLVDSDEGKPAQLIKFLDQIRTDIISRNDLNSENITNKISGIAHLIESLSRHIKIKDGDKADLNNILIKSDEKYKELSKMEADLRDAQ